MTLTFSQNVYGFIIPKMDGFGDLFYLCYNVFRFRKELTSEEGLCERVDDFREYPSPYGNIGKIFYIEPMSFK